MGRFLARGRELDHSFWGRVQSPDSTVVNCFMNNGLSVLWLEYDRYSRARITQV